MKKILRIGSSTNRFESLETFLNTTEHTAHVQLTGDDINGDGTIDAPYKTVERAVQDAQGVVNTLIINISAGVHDVDLLTVSQKKVIINGGGSLRLKGDGAKLALITERGALHIYVDVTDNGIGNDVFLISDYSADFRMYSRKLSLKDVTGSLFRSGVGANALRLSGVTATSQNAISKYANSNVFDENVSSTTFTNIS